MNANKGYNFKFTNLCGVAYECGDARFVDDNRIVSPVGNRLNLFDLKEHFSQTYAFETKHALRRVAVHGNSLAVCDEEGRGMLVNKSTGAVLHRFNFKGRTGCLQFCPYNDGRYLAACVENRTRIWLCPTKSTAKSFSPLVLHRTFGGHTDDITCLDWSPEGFFVTGSKDTTVRIHALAGISSEHDEARRARAEEDEDDDERAEEEDEEGLPFAEDDDHDVLRHDDTNGKRKKKKKSSYSTILAAHKTQLVGVFVRDASSILESPSSSRHPLLKIYSVSEDGSLFEWTFDGNQRKWTLSAKHYLQKSHAKITSAASARGSDLLLVGFSDGVFSLFEMSTGETLQTLSVSKFAIDSADVSRDGAWLLMGSSTMGQLLCWEWRSETYVLKQQGHYYAVNTCAYSEDGRFVATGGDDAKLKVWSASSGTCFVTFSEARAPISDVCFSRDAVLAASLDGAVRAYDLGRMRCFRTLLPPSPCQLTCLAVDEDVVVAGAFEPPSVFVWSLRTGRLLDTLAGHEAPLSSLCFAPGGLLLSSSWDKTVRVWRPYAGGECVETLTHSSDVLAACVRPDGKEACAATADGTLTFWSLGDDSRQTNSIDCRRDLAHREPGKAGGQNLRSVAYTSDGACVLAGGTGEWTYIYNVANGALLKKFQLSHQSETGGLKEDDEGGDDAEDARRKRHRVGTLPGATRGKDARSTALPPMRVNRVCFSPSGTGFLAAANRGLFVFSLDSGLLFDPVDFSENVTPGAVANAVRAGEFPRALLLALHLGERELVEKVMDSTPAEEITAAARSIPNAYLRRALDFFAARLTNDANRALEGNLTWALRTLEAKHDVLAPLGDSPEFLPALRALSRAIAIYGTRLKEMCDRNVFDLRYLLVSDGGRDDGDDEKDA